MRQESIGGRLEADGTLSRHLLAGDGPEPVDDEPRPAGTCGRARLETDEIVALKELVAESCDGSTASRCTRCASIRSG